MSVEVGVLLTPTQMDYIKNAYKASKPLKLNFSKKQVLGTHIFVVSKKQADKLKSSTEKGEAELELTAEQVKRFVRKEGRGLFEGKGVLEDEQEKEIKIKKALVAKDLAPKIKSQKTANEILKAIKAIKEFKELNKTQEQQLLDTINEKLVIFGFIRPGKKGGSARKVFLGICEKLGIKTELGECHMKGHNYTGPGTKIEKKIANLDELQEKFKGDLSKLTLKDLKYTDDKWKPINRIDEISAVHDVQYGIAGKVAKDAGDEIKLQNKADVIMMEKLRQVKKSNPTTQEKYEYYLAYPAILAKLGIEESAPVKSALAIKDNISDIASVVKGNKGVLPGLFSIVTRTMNTLAENIGIKKTASSQYGSVWNSLLEASLEFTKDVVVDAAKVIGSKFSAKKITDATKEIKTELTMPIDATPEEYSKRLEDIRTFETEELNEEEIDVEPKEEHVPTVDEPLEQVKKDVEKEVEELPPTEQPTVLLTQVNLKKKGKGLGMKVPKEYKNLHPLFSDEIEAFANLNNISPYNFVMRNGDRPDIQDKHFILVNLDDKNGQGTHYTGIYINGNDATYFDPFGLPPPNEIKRWLKNNKLKAQYTSNQLQDKKSIMCGYYVSLFLYMMKSGVSPYDFLYDKGFEHDKIEKNDQKLKEYFGM